jgi:hypothetical protein
MNNQTTNAELQSTVQETANAATEPEIADDELENVAGGLVLAHMTNGKY